MTSGRVPTTTKTFNILHQPPCRREASVTEGHGEFAHFSHHSRVSHFFLFSGSSGLDPPRKIRRPSLNVMFEPFARFIPFFARYPSTVSSVPTCRDSFVKPRRSRMFGLPPSTIQLSTLPSEPITSMWIHA